MSLKTTTFEQRLEYENFDNLAQLLYNFLPASGNDKFSFPVAAAKAGISEFWEEIWTKKQSKKPAIFEFLKIIYFKKKLYFPKIIVEIVFLSKEWRKRRNEPLTRREIEELIEILSKLDVEIIELDKFCTMLSADTNTMPEESILDERKKGTKVIINHNYDIKGNIGVLGNFKEHAKVEIHQGTSADFSLDQVKDSIAQTKKNLPEEKEETISPSKIKRFIRSLRAICESVLSQVIATLILKK